MAARQYRTLSKRIVDRLAVDDKDAVFWEPGASRIRASRLPLGHQGLRRPDALRRTLQAGDRRTTWRCLTRPGPQGSRSHHCPNQGRRRAHPGRAEGDRPRDGRTRRALPARARRDALQAGDRDPLRHHARQAHPTCAWKAQGRRCRAQAHPGVPVRAAREAHGGEPRARYAHQDVQLGRGVGAAPAREKSLSVRAPVQGAAAARAVPHAGGAPPDRTCPRCRTGRTACLDSRSGSHPAIGADRVSAKRDSRPTLGGRGLRGGASFACAIRRPGPGWCR